MLPLRAKQFVPLTYRSDLCLYKEASSSLEYSRTYKGVIFAEPGRHAWNFGRFVRTLYFFNSPNPPKVRLFVKYEDMYPFCFF